MTAQRFDNVTGVILAGGRSQRMGGEDKGLIPLGGKAMVEYVIASLRPQVFAVMINANRNLEEYRKFDVPVVTDTLDGYLGPLAGMASAMQMVETELLVTAPCDSPFCPDVLVQRLMERLVADHAEIAVAHSGERMQPVFTLLHAELMHSLLGFLSAGERKIDKWFQSHKVAVADFSDLPDTFLNINTPEERTEVECRLRRVL
ncbi:MAG: molybdenum cofactor guanylyltransferase [Gammaproteobacteria bacterium]|nr:molybdenum cofactor guanylyltransferase [Gammaproteobacteria bacterium]